MREQVCRRSASSVLVGLRPRRRSAAARPSPGLARLGAFCRRPRPALPGRRLVAATPCARPGPGARGSGARRAAAPRPGGRRAGSRRRCARAILRFRKSTCVVLLRQVEAGESCASSVAMASRSATLARSGLLSVGALLAPSPRGSSRRARRWRARSSSAEAATAATASPRHRPAVDERPPREVQVLRSTAGRLRGQRDLPARRAQRAAPVSRQQGASRPALGPWSGGRWRPSSGAAGHAQPLGQAVQPDRLELGRRRQQHAARARAGEAARRGSCG